MINFERIFIIIIFIKNWGKFLLLIVLSTSLETILSLLSLQKFLEGLSVLILFLLRFSEILLILFLFPKLLRIISTINAI